MKRIGIILFIVVELFAKNAGTSFGCCSGECDLLNFWGNAKNYSLDSILLKNKSNILLWKYIEPTNVKILGEGSDVIDMHLVSSIGDSVIVEMYSNIGVTREKKILANEFDCTEIYRGCGFSLIKGGRQSIRALKNDKEIIYELYEDGKKLAVLKAGWKLENEKLSDKSNNFIVEKGTGNSRTFFFDGKKVESVDMNTNYNKYPNFFRLFYLSDNKQSKKVADFVLDNINIEKDSLNSGNCFNNF